MICDSCKFDSFGCYDEPCNSCEWESHFVLKWRKTFWAKMTMFGIIALAVTLTLLVLAGCTLVEYGGAKYLSLGGRSFDKLTITKDPNSITVEVINYEKKSPTLIIEIPGAKIKSGGGQ